MRSIPLVRIVLPVLVIATGTIVAFGLMRDDAPAYDFPLARKVQKELEDLTNSTGVIVSTKEYAAPSSAHSTAPEPSAEELPAKILIEVPYMVQAPFGNWSMPYQEACEEASLIMVHHFLTGQPITPAEADKAILSMVQWENEEFNYSADVTLEELKRIAEDYYHHTGQLFYDPSIQDMKRLLAAGHPIIVPLAGREIGNPYYSGEGPWYHMLVVTGYDSANFITNDPGTKRGKHFKYPQKRLHNSIHNWTGAKEDIKTGRKVILVLEK